jgi:hypothetical protein
VVGKTIDLPGITQLSISVILYFRTGPYEFTLLLPTPVMTISLGELRCISRSMISMARRQT